MCIIGGNQDLNLDCFITSVTLFHLVVFFVLVSEQERIFFSQLITIWSTPVCSRSQHNQEEIISE